MTMADDYRNDEDDYDIWPEDNPNIASSSSSYDFECIDIQVGDYDLSEFNLTERQYQELAYVLIENVIGKEFEDLLGEGGGDGNKVWDVVDVYSKKEAKQIWDHLGDASYIYYRNPTDVYPEDLPADLRDTFNKKLKEWFDKGLEGWEPDEIDLREDGGVYEPDDFSISYRMSFEPDASGYIEFTDGSEYEW